MSSESKITPRKLLKIPLWRILKLIRQSSSGWTAIHLSLIVVRGVLPLLQLYLLKLIIDSFQAKVPKIVVTALQNEIYYAKIFIEANSNVFAIDARPSDSIALALRTRSTIFVDPKIMNDNGWVLDGDQNVATLIERLRKTKPEQFGSFDLEK